MASSVEAAFAVMAGLWKVELRTTMPIPTRGTSGARPDVSAQQSKAIDSPGHFESGCSPVQIDSKPSFSAVWAISTMRAQARPGSQPSNSLK